MLAQLLDNPEAQAKAERKLAFHNPDLKVGGYVELRYVREAHGRIIGICAKGIPGQAEVSNSYGVYKVRMDDGEIRYEHPEHLRPALPPKLEVVRPPMSDLGQSLFDMMTSINKASAMQCQIDAFFKRKD